jgi:hypothetical protein
LVHREFFFRQDGKEPTREIFPGFSAAHIDCLSPSGLVPGDVAAGHRCKLHDGGEGPDCYSCFLFKVILVKCEGFAVFFVSSL